MRKALTTLLIFSFSGIAIFGILSMAHSMGGMHDGCIASTLNGEACPGEANTLQALAFHFDSSRSFSTATFAETLTSSLVLLALLLFIRFGIDKDNYLRLSAPATNFRRKLLLEFSYSPLPRELTHWLSLHENSPAVF